MTLDSEQQRAFLLELFNAAQIPGAHIALAYSIRVALEQAKVEIKEPS